MTAAPPAPVVLGAGGYIGQEFVRLLAGHPSFGSPQLVGGGRSEGKRLGEVWRLSEPCPSELAGQRIRKASARSIAASADVAFGAIPSGLAGPLESELSRRGVAVFSNASDHREDADHPLLIPEVNGAHLALLERRRRGTAPIVTNPNCTATGLVLALAPIVDLLKPRAVFVATYQALSGAGYPGVPSLAVTDNVVPFIEEEEEKVAEESQRLLGRFVRGRVQPATFPLVAQCARVGVREGHLEAVTVEANREPSRTELELAWRNFDPLRGLALPTAPHPPIELRPGPDRPQPLFDRWAGAGRAAGMAATIGRIRWDPPYLRFFVVSHNAVRGGAGGSVLNAEYALAQGAWIGRKR